MFSSDIIFFTANRQQQNYSRVIYPLYRAYSEWQQCLFLQAGPGCIPGVAPCSYITAHLIVEYHRDSYTSNKTTNNCKAIRARIVYVECTALTELCGY